jgi:hypothetical protein
MTKSDRMNAKSPPITSASEPAQALALFGPPLLLPDEDAAAFKALLDRISAVVKPVDFIDEMFVDDLVWLEREVLQWRRLKASVVKERGQAALVDFLLGVLDYESYADQFVKCLTEALLADPDYSQDEERTRDIVEQCSRNESEGIDCANLILESTELDVDKIHDRAQAKVAQKLAQDYARHEPRAIKQVRALLEAAGRTMEDLAARALEGKLDYLDRLDRLATIAESRRNATLREIDRRRAALGQAPRRSVQDIEDGEFKVIEMTPTKGKSAA